jgi:hypothetical protein
MDFFVARMINDQFPISKDKYICKVVCIPLAKDTNILLSERFPSWGLEIGKKQQSDQPGK